MREGGKEGLVEEARGGRATGQAVVRPEGEARLRLDGARALGDEERVEGRIEPARA